MASTVGFGVAAFAVLFQVVIYCAIAFVIWKFYQIISKIGEDVAAIKAALGHDTGEPSLDLEIPQDPLV
jgi:hypothetical protein